jgi:hypothetical protein
MAEKRMSRFHSYLFFSRRQIHIEIKIVNVVADHRHQNEMFAMSRMKNTVSPGIAKSKASRHSELLGFFILLPAKPLAHQGQGVPEGNQR